MTESSLRSRLPLLAILPALLLLVGCKSNPAEPEISGVEPIEVSLEAPTAPPRAAPHAMAERDAEIAALRAEKDALASEIDRIQSKNRAFAMEAARLREEVLSRPMTQPQPMLADAGGGSMGGANTYTYTPPADPTPARSEVASSGRSGAASGAYSVQTACYSDSAKGRKSAEKLVGFFEGEGYTPAMYRKSGKYLIVLVGAYGSRSEANAAKGEIASLAYFGRKGDFKSATVRKN